MKYAFLISIAMFAFAVSCGKKDKKQQVGKTAPGTQLDCKGKDEQEKKCKDQLSAEQAAQNAGTTDNSTPRKESGTEENISEMKTIPNTKDKDLKARSRVSIQLNNQTALVAELKVGAENDTLIPFKVICPEDLNSVKDVSEANPDDLQASANILLFNGSVFVADLKVNKGENKTENTKLYMLSCKSKSTIKASQYKSKETDKSVNFRGLVTGQQAFESIILSGKKDSGILTSFECGSDDDILKEDVKKLGSRVVNRIRLKNGSAVMVYRAIEQKIGDKKLNQYGTDAQKEHKISIIACNV
ncbi:MAG: hypothetical protein JNL11_09290 [Bdellovibrionaceae bacterium]|nr:hypothetical protein [Pseudobdellovibrionaceae bacterium]